MGRSCWYEIEDKKMRKMVFFLIHTYWKEKLWWWLMYRTRKMRECYFTQAVTEKWMASCKLNISFFENIPTFQLSWEISVAVYWIDTVSIKCNTFLESCVKNSETRHSKRMWQKDVEEKSLIDWLKTAKRETEEQKTEREREWEPEETCNPLTLMDRVPSPFIPVVVVDFVLSSDWRTKSLACKPPKVSLAEIATLRFSIPFSGFIAVLKNRMKYTITLPGLKVKTNKNSNK